MRIEKVKTNEMVLIRLNPGDDILLSLKEAVKQEGIENGWILNCAGSVSAHHFHVVSSRVNPPEETFVKASAPADVIGLSGMILDGKVHAHIVFSNDKTAYGGHLEEGTTVLTFFALAIIPLSVSLKAWDSIGDLES